MPIRKVELYDKGQLVGYDEINVSDELVAQEAAAAKSNAAREKMKAIKAKGQANITQADLVEGFLAACDIVDV